MPNFETKLSETVFFVSPSDQYGLRKQAKKVIRGINKNYLRGKSRKLVLKTARDDVRPNYGKHPQNHIHDTIGENYDLLVVVFGKLAGHPVPDAASGTISEFNRAAVRNKEHGHPEIFLYRNISEIIHWDCDIEQLITLHEFAKTHNNNGLWKTFRTADDFEKILLKNIIQFLEASSSETEPKEVGEAPRLSQVLSKLRKTIKK